MKLEQTIYHGICLMKCPECHGVLMEQKDIRLLMDRLSADLLLKITFDYPIEARPKDPTMVHCPYCKEDMQNYSYMEAGTVNLNCCLSCQVLWADAEELGEMSLLHARTQRRYDDRRKIEIANRLEAAKNSEAVSRHYRAQLGMYVGVTLGGIL